MYNFRPWQSLEATGRSGSDGGFEVRGWEKVTDDTLENSAIDEENEPILSNYNSRLWLIQCKREKSINPKKIANYVKSLLSNNEPLYGIILVCSCDLSKKTRDTFKCECLDPAPL